MMITRVWGGVLCYSSAMARGASMASTRHLYAIDACRLDDVAATRHQLGIDAIDATHTVAAPRSFRE